MILLHGEEMSLPPALPLGEGFPREKRDLLPEHCWASGLHQNSPLRGDQGCAHLSGGAEAGEGHTSHAAQTTSALGSGL